MSGDRYFAHSAPNREHWEPARVHSEAVSRRTAGYAAAFGAGSEGAATGLLHDLGKLSDLFLRRLEGLEKGLDHWSPGAWAALRFYGPRGYVAALAIQGHHIGLQSGAAPALKSSLDPRSLAQGHPLGLRLTEPDHEILLSRLEADGLTPPEIPASITSLDAPHLELMLDVRMLFSALVDADFIETEAHFAGAETGERRYRPAGLPLAPERAARVLEDHLNQLAADSRAAGRVVELRRDLLEACREAALSPPGLFTLTAPTGSGKTLAMLDFALRHAREHGKRRIVVAIPYLSILEQTAGVYRDLLEPAFGEGYVLEHHSLARLDGEPSKPGADADHEEEPRRLARQLAENWDAPVVLTTNVQLLQSLFANRPSACRKLHRLADSILLFDEAQTLPPHLAVPTLGTLSHLARRYGATVVLATATQPAFDHLHPRVVSVAREGWRPREIAAPALNLFDRARRTQVVWEVEERVEWGELAARLAALPQVLAIVNLKRHAQALTEELAERGGKEGLLHLTTNLCPAHRQKVLEEVRCRLERREPCRLIATQCVEAGVDLDFPTVFRALGPLEAIAQAAGRCNRNGHLFELGVVHVFRPPLASGERSEYPPGGYKQAAAVTGQLLKERGPEGMDLDSPALFREYYKLLYDLAKMAEEKEELRSAIISRNFVDVAARYQIIEGDTIEVLVPYDLKAFAEMRGDLMERGTLTREWIRRARPHAVSLFRPRRADDLRQWCLEPAPLGRKGASDQWFLYTRTEDYDCKLLGLKTRSEVWIA